MSPAAVNKAIRKAVEPLLLDHGFIKHSERRYIRERGELVDCVAIQLGRGNESFYLHHSISLASDMVLASDLAYRVGGRLQEGVDGNSWIIGTGNQIDDVLQSICRTIKECSLAFFESVAGVRDFVIELASDVNHRSRLFHFDLAIALAILGRKNRVIQLCEETMFTARSTDALPEEERRRIYELAVLLREAVTKGAHQELLGRWRNSRRELLGLST